MLYIYQYVIYTILLYICIWMYMSIFCYYNKIPKGLDTLFKNRLV